MLWVRVRFGDGFRLSNRVWVRFESELIKKLIKISGEIQPSLENMLNYQDLEKFKRIYCCSVHSAPALFTG